ncbi:hypothetical protein D3C75_676150 [compost metagenome]
MSHILRDTIAFDVVGREFELRLGGALLGHLLGCCNLLSRVHIARSLKQPKCKNKRTRIALNTVFYDEFDQFPALTSSRKS